MEQIFKTVDTDWNRPKRKPGQKLKRGPKPSSGGSLQG